MGDASRVRAVMAMVEAGTPKDDGRKIECDMNGLGFFVRKNGSALRISTGRLCGFFYGHNGQSRIFHSILRIPMAKKITTNPAPLRIAVLVDTSTSWGRRIIEGVHQYQSGHTRWQLFVEPRGLEQRSWLPAGWKGDGVIARVGFPDLSNQLKALGIPVVNVSAIRLPENPFPRIGSDMAAAAEMAADHLLHGGFRRFAYFSLLGSDYVAEHEEAFRNRLEKAGCSLEVFGAAPQRAEGEPEWMPDLGRVAEWLCALPKPVAILTWNTGGAREVLYACARAGLKVPEEISVMSGSEDDLFCKVAPVPISAVNPAAEEIGFRAAEYLDELMARPEAAKRKDTLIPPLGVVVRQSTETWAVDDPALVTALRFIRDHATLGISVNEVAARAGLCRRALEQRFAKALGSSPAGEIRREKVERAIYLLQTTRLSVAEVALRTGFASSEYMATVFRKKYGVTPLGFRERMAAV